jgi:hypothetical protein
MSEARTFFAGTSDNLMNQIFFFVGIYEGGKWQSRCQTNFKKKFLKNEI